jgi:hypothetical protein
LAATVTSLSDTQTLRRTPRLAEKRESGASCAYGSSSPETQRTVLLKAINKFQGEAKTNGYTITEICDTSHKAYPGYGNFAHRPIGSGAQLPDLVGEALTLEQVKRRFPQFPVGPRFLVEVTKDSKYIDMGNPALSNSTRFFNCSRGIGPPNIKAVFTGSVIQFVTLRRITIGEELVWDYGDGYVLSADAPDTLANDGVISFCNKVPPQDPLSK